MKKSFLVLSGFTGLIVIFFSIFGFNNFEKKQMIIQMKLNGNALVLLDRKCMVLQDLIIREGLIKLKLLNPDSVLLLQAEEFFSLIITKQNMNLSAII